MTTLTINLHRPHAKQLAFKRSQAKRKVIVAGRRGGKTTGLADIAIEGMLDGQRVLEAAPSADQTDAFWASVKSALAAPIAAGIFRKLETTRTVEMPGGGRIRAKTAYNADMLRGDYADLLILDEFADMDPNAWAQVGAPMLLDNGGDAVFIGTPKRKNHLFALYQRALGDTTGRWEAFHFTSHDNPYLDGEALEEITFDMTDEDYRQEIMAEFLDNEGAVFRNIAACMTAPDAKPEEHAGHFLVAGVDWGKQADYTAISVGCADCKVEVWRDRFNQIDYTLQRGRLAGIYERWRPAAILAESNAMGEPIIEQLQADGLPVAKFMTTATSKPPLIENMVLTLERAEWQFQPDPIWSGELEAYERTISPATGRSRYNAPAGVHDDTVIARCLMIRQAQQGKTSSADNPFYQ